MEFLQLYKTILSLPQRELLLLAGLLAWLSVRLLGLLRLKESVKVQVLGREVIEVSARGAIRRTQQEKDETEAQEELDTLKRGNPMLSYEAERQDLLKSRPLNARIK